MATITFSFTDKEILREVTKRTSLLGKFRGTEERAQLLERLSLTEGEQEIFDDFLEDAMVHVYDWISSYGRGVTDACQHIEVDDEKTIVYTINEPENYDANLKYSTWRYLRNGIVSYIMYLWLQYAYPENEEEAEKQYADSEASISSAKGSMESDSTVDEDGNVVMLYRPYNWY